MNVKNFFKDKDGKVVIAQPPNLLLSVWIILKLVDLFFVQGKFSPITVLSTAVLFAWAYNELRQGVSPFRKVLGSVVLAVILISLFVQ